MKRKMTCLNLLQCLSPDDQISIPTRISKSSIWNNDACMVLHRVLGNCRIIVQRCMSIGDENISQGVVANFPECFHLVSLVELRGQIVM